MEIYPLILNSYTRRPNDQHIALYGLISRQNQIPHSRVFFSDCYCCFCANQSLQQQLGKINLPPFYEFLNMPF